MSLQKLLFTSGIVKPQHREQSTVEVIVTQGGISPIGYVNNILSVSPGEAVIDLHDS
jgi:hypothetical protein